MKSIKGLLDFGGILLLVVVVIGTFVLPIPTWLLNISIALNLTFDVMILVISFQSKKTLDFPLYPTLLLVATIFGFAVNIAVNRHILTKGADCDEYLVRLISDLASGNGIKDVIIGFTIFIAIIMILTATIIEETERISKREAQFTFNFLPGKLTAILEKYSSGSITNEEYTAREEELQQETDFYGSIDGACKFISGSVKFLLFCTSAVIFGGIIISLEALDELAVDTIIMAIINALETYMPLAIGSGMLFLLHIILLSLSARMIVERASKSPGDDTDVRKQVQEKKESGTP